MCSACPGPNDFDLGVPYCLECIKSLKQCVYCKNIVSNTTQIGHLVLCNECVEMHTFKCGCGKITLSSDVYMGLDNQRYCTECFHTMYCYCEQCDNLFDLGDIHCGRCDSCRGEFMEIDGLSSPEFKHRYGLELECLYNEDEDEVEISGWNSVEDGSIDPSGIEYNSPVFSGDCSKHIKEFCSEARRVHDINKSCGFHLHLESKGFSDEKLTLIYKNCKNLENWFFNIVALSRRSSTYCKRLSTIETMKKFDDAWYDTSDHRGRKNSKYDQTRYYWVNFHSHYYRNTIEIRLHQGTIDHVKIMNWVKIWQAVFNLDHEVFSPEEFVEPELLEYYKNKFKPTLIESF